MGAYWESVGGGGGTRWPIWLRHCATSRKVAGSIPQCALWPPTRRHAVMWIVTNVVLFRTRPNQELTLRNFIAFMQTNKYKLCQTVKRRLLVADYLCVLDVP